MIHSLSIKNFLSFKEEVTFSFEATKDKKLEDYQVVEVAKGVRLLKLGIIYGANASGKSNLLYAFDFLRRVWLSTFDNKDEKTGLIPFMLDDSSRKEVSKFNLVFYVDGKKFVYNLEINKRVIFYECLYFYPGVQPKIVFERTYDNISKIEYGASIKINKVAKDQIGIKCLSNMSVFAAYNQVNVEIFEIELALSWMKNQFMEVIEPEIPLSHYVENLIYKDDKMKDEVLNYLKEADFNISAIHTKFVKEDMPEFVISSFLENSNLPLKEKERIRKEKTFEIPRTSFEHRVYDKEGNLHYHDLPEELQSKGTLRTFELAVPILQAIKRNAFLAIDEIESSLHPKLVEFIIENFLKDSKCAQLLVTTHYDCLLEEDDLIRKDNIWFTEKNEDASTNLYSLSDFKAVNRITSFQKAYKYGKFGAIPNID